MSFYCNVLRNSRLIGIVMNFLENKFLFKLELYFTQYMHANTKNKMWASKNFLFLIVLYIKFFLTSQSSS